jgi:hypothetical protein
MWFTRMWFNKKITPDLIKQDRERLSGRGNAEIAARLLRRAELHDDSNAYLARCSTLDRIAAHRILDLERRLALVEKRDAQQVTDQVETMLRILREPN